MASHSELWQLTAAKVLPSLHNGKISAVEYMQELLSRIREQDLDIRGWVHIDEDLVLQRARQLDALPAGQRGPLHGLAIGVKDIMLTKDMPTQYNSRLFESSQAIGVDANCIMALRAMGAIIVGKTSTTEFACSKQGGWHQNQTRNARDQQCTPGGSSSGSGAVVADRQVPVALGTQTGGSIVRPASFNGCYGFKPTWGSISREGVAQWCITFDTCGFFTRSVEDLEILAAGFRIHDDESTPEQAFTLAGSKIGFCKTHNWSNAGSGTRNAMEKAKSILQKHGCTVQDVDLPDDFSRVLEWHHTIMIGEGRSSFLGQYLTDKDKLHENISGYVENKSGVSRKQLLQAYDGCARLRPVFDDIASQYDGIITPSVVDEAPVGLENTGDMSFCSTWTALHCPALNIPGFVGEHGRPIGLTAVAPRCEDRRLLHVSKALGVVFEGEGGWQET